MLKRKHWYWRSRDVKHATKGGRSSKHRVLVHMLSSLAITHANSAHQMMPNRKKVAVYAKQIKATTTRNWVLSELWKKSAEHSGTCSYSELQWAGLTWMHAIPFRHSCSCNAYFCIHSTRDCPAFLHAQPAFCFLLVLAKHTA